MKRNMFMAAALLLTITAFVGSCQKEKLHTQQAIEKNGPGGAAPPPPPVCTLDGQIIDGGDPQFQNALHVYCDADANAYRGFTSDALFDAYVAGCNSPEMKARWEVAKAIRTAVADQGITHALSQDELFALIPKDLKKKYDITRGEYGDEAPKLIGFVQLHDQSYLGKGTGCNKVFWGWGVNLTQVNFCGGGNWNDRPSHISEWFGVHGLFWNINLTGGSIWFVGVGGEFPMPAPSYLQLWDNQLSSVL